MARRHEQRGRDVISGSRLRACPGSGGLGCNGGLPQAWWGSSRDTAITRGGSAPVDAGSDVPARSSAAHFAPFVFEQVMLCHRHAITTHFPAPSACSVRRALFLCRARGAGLTSQERGEGARRAGGRSQSPATDVREVLYGWLTITGHPPSSSSGGNSRMKASTLWICPS